ncbi:hypothetical protein M9H77_03604 [Catharanthus roseus]|uniref:Uncharacterized protein n=1 Tax=Catharanthus roseus TaxID=4058 RepID=A0ACC0CC60_CATRO|nr:hypothetical protein M9H77_03604 [Catharanthus roseus]
MLHFSLRSIEQRQRHHRPSILTAQHETTTVFLFESILTDITTSVKGVRIYLDRARLAQILGILDEGHSVFYESASMSIFTDPNWVYSEALARFGVQAQAVGKRLLNTMV